MTNIVHTYSDTKNLIDFIQTNDVKIHKSLAQIECSDEKTFIEIKHTIEKETTTCNILHVNCEQNSVRINFTLYDINCSINDFINRENSTEHNSLFDNGPVVTFSRIQDDNCWRVNEVTGSVSQWGYSREFFLNDAEAIKSVIYPDDHELVKSNLMTHIQEGDTHFKQEYRIYDKNKKIRWVEDYTSIYRDSKNNAIKLVGYVLDTTESKNNYNDLQYSKKELSNYLDNISDLIITHTADGEIIYANNFAKERLEYTEDSLKDIKLFDMLDSMSQSMFTNFLQRVQVGISAALEDNFITASHEKFPSEIKTVRLSGEEERFITIARDISDKKETLISFQERETLYLGIINSTSEGFWLLDVDQKILDVNYALCAMIGYEKVELLGRSPYDFMDESNHDICHEQSESIEDTAQRVYEIILKKKDGSQIHAVANASTLYELDGEVKTFAFMRDISKQKEQDERLLKRQIEIEQRNNNLQAEISTQVELNRDKDRMMYQQSRLASMGEMIGNIAHQWRQPLNILALVLQDIYISGQLGNLTDKKLEDEYEKANNVLQYMSQTIDDFRNFFKQSSSDNDTFSLKEIIESVYSLVSTNFEYNHVKFNNLIETDAIARGNQNEFKQVVINILNNAQEAILTSKRKDGFVSIALEMGEEFTTIQIKDNGGGISSEIISKIFDPYFTTKHQTQGTGLGLYMSKQIIETSMNGSLEATNLKEGALFLIKMPNVVNEVCLVS